MLNDAFSINAVLRQCMSGNSPALADHPEQQMNGIGRGVVESIGFRRCKADNSSSAVGELLE